MFRYFSDVYKRQDDRIVHLHALLNRTAVVFKRMDKPVSYTHLTGAVDKGHVLEIKFHHGRLDPVYFTD